jgi:putative tryptophan/tyrosine transport system substrate-binding protein
MRRRQFVMLLGVAAVWPLVARAQQAQMPVVGILRSTPADPFTKLVDAFRQGLLESGFVEGENVAVEYRYADNHLERLPSLATELVRRPVNVIVANSLAAEAARSVSTTIPIVFVTADDPVTRGLVASLSRPGGNLTGLTFFGGGLLGAKRLELLHELVPTAAVVGFLMDPNWPGAKAELPDVRTAARALGQHIVVVEAASADAFEMAFLGVLRAGAHALVVSGSPMFNSERRVLVEMAARHGLPAIYDIREHVQAGGLMSYGASLPGAYREAGVYAGRILKGAKPAELPVAQPTKFELVINLKTAKGLGLVVPNTLLVAADEVIE